MAKIKLTIGSEKRNIIFFSSDYFYPDPQDKVLINKELLNLNKQLGLIDKNYEQTCFPVLSDFDRYSPYAYRTKGDPFGGLFHLTMEITDNDELFYHWFKTCNATHGALEFYKSGEEYLPFRRIEFWDGWISELSEKMSSTDSRPMLLHCVISAATVRYNKSLVFRKNWFVTDIFAKPAKEVVREKEKILVRKIAGKTEALSGEQVEYTVTEYSKSENNVSDIDKKNIRWAVKVDGRQEELKDIKGEKVSIEIKEEWTGKEILVMACLNEFTENVSRKTKIIKWKLPVYFAESKRKMGYEEDGSISPDMTYLDMTNDDVLKLHKYFKYQIPLTDEQLFEEMLILAKDFSIFGGWENTKAMINHFRYKKGAMYSSPFLDNALKTHSSLQRFLNKGDKSVMAILTNTLNGYKGNINLIKNSLEGAIGSYRVKFNKWADYLNGKKITVDDTHSYQIQITDYELSEENMFKATLYIEVFDHFGLDEKDIKTFGSMALFRAWYLLQHVRGYQPFVTKMTCSCKISGIF